MYGQFKGTVRCAECGNISITFDPFLTLPLPISKGLYFDVTLVPFEIFRQATADDDDEDEQDPDFKVGSMV